MPSASSFNFIAFYRPTRAAMLTEGPTPQECEAITAHVQYLSSLEVKGIVWFAGRTQVADERTVGVCVFKSASQSDAEALVKADPCLIHAVMTAEVLPFRVAVPGT